MCPRKFLKRWCRKLLITKGFGIDVNIIFGDIDIVADTPVEGIVAIFDDEPVRIDAALNYLRQRNIAAEVLKEG